MIYATLIRNEKYSKIYLSRIFRHASPKRYFDKCLKNKTTGYGVGQSQ